LEQQRIVEVEVTSAAPLSETSRESLAVVMGARTGRMVTLIEHVDPKVMGGLVVLVGDEQIDLSVAKQLRKFHDAVVEHGSRRIHAGADFFEGAMSF
jgi:F-type H+-transporting ATPase subunit delta